MQLPTGCRLVTLPAFEDERGTLSFLEAGRHIPFEIRRIFYLYGVPEGRGRAAHALIKCQQCVIAIAGSFEVQMDDGQTKGSVRLEQPTVGLYLPPRVWRELVHFSAGAVCLVLASELYDRSDYYEEYDEFLRAVRGKRA